MALTKKEAKSKNILDVAQALGMELRRTGSSEYMWTEHDSLKLNTRYNTWKRWSTGEGGDVISLVEYVKDISFKQALQWLDTGEFSEVEVVETSLQPFQYSLGPYEKPFKEARTYLKETRGLSDETIDFFIKQGVLAQATKKARDGYLEEVVVFKYLDKNKELVGVSLQGTVQNQKRYEKKGYLKQIAYQSQGTCGFNVTIGTPKRLVFAEAPIDLMSYYELHKDKLTDVRLVSMDGLKPGVISRFTFELLQERGIITPKEFDYTNPKDIKQVSDFLTTSFLLSTHSKNETAEGLITLAVDNDKAARNKLVELMAKGVPLKADLPPLGEGQSKSDWNDVLKASKLQKESEINEAMTDYDSQKSLAPGAQRLIDEGMVLRHPNLANRYMAKLDTGVTNLVLTADGHFALPDGFQAQTEEQGIAIQQLLDSQYLITSSSPSLSPGAKALVDNGTLKQWAKQPNIYFVKGVKGLALELGNDGLFKAQEGQYAPKAQEYKELIQDLLSQQEEGNQLQFAEEVSNQDKETEKALADMQELSNAGDFHRNPDFLGAEAPGSVSKPVADSPQPDFPVITPLQFTTKGETMSSIKPGYHVITSTELNRLNKFAPGLQATAQWYLNEVANSRIIYLYQNGSEQERLEVSFTEENFAHLTGIAPKERPMFQVVHDFAEGRGDYGNIQVSHAIKDKSMVLPLLPDILSAQSFVFDDLSSVEKMNRIDLSKAIKTEDSDLLLALRDVDGIGIPASIMRIKDKLSLELEGKDKVILGVYRERDGIIEQLSVNEEYVKDKGETMLQLLQEGQLDPIIPEVTASSFTAVLDSVYNGIKPVNMADVPEECQAAWQAYFELIEAKELSIDELMVEADSRGWLDKDTDFYRDRLTDKIYQEAYHVRLLEVEVYPSGTDLPFKPGQIIDYVSFAKELYTQNQAVLESGKSLDLPLSVSQFEVYAPGGELIRGGIDYRLGQENQPISQLMGIAWETKEQRALVDLDKELLGELGLAHDLERFGQELDEHIVAIDKVLEQSLTGGLNLSVIEGLYTLGVEQYTNIVYNPGTAPNILRTIDVFTAHYKANDQDLDKTIESLATDGLLDTDSSFYKDWSAQKTNQEASGRLSDTLPESDVPDQESPKEAPEGLDSHQEETTETRTVAQMIDDKDTKALAQYMKEGITAFRNSEKYKEFLLVMSKFHKYSTRNVQLIYAQNPKATRVASFKQWKDDFGRQVTKGQKSIKVWAPIQVVMKDQDGKPMLDEKGKEKTQLRFRLVPVFDVSQTTGKELPKQIERLEGTVENYPMLFEAARASLEEKQIGLSFHPNLGGPNGYYVPQENHIVLQEGLSYAQTLKTLFHEMAHSDLHNLEKQANEITEKSHAELQAESVAFVVSAHYGFDTSSYTMPYLNTWLTDKVEMSDLEAQLSIVQQEAKELITRIDSYLEKVQQKEVVADTFSQKLAQAEQEESQEIGGDETTKKQEVSHEIPLDR